MVGIGIALGIFSGFMQADATRRSGKRMESSYAQQAAILEERARIQAMDVLEEGEQVAGEIVSQTGGSGVKLMGSPYIAMMDSLRAAEEDAAKIKKFAAQEAQYLRQTGRATRRSAEDQAFAQMLGAGGQAFGQYAAYSNITDAKGS